MDRTPRRKLVSKSEFLRISSSRILIATSVPSGALALYTRQKAPPATSLVRVNPKSVLLGALAEVYHAR